MVFYPPKSTGLAIGLGLLAGLIALGALSLALIFSQAPSPLTFLLVCVVIAIVPAAGWLGYRCLGLLNARYMFSPEALSVEWGGRREVIPLPDVEEAHLATEFAGDLRPPWPNWPGCVVGRLQQPTLGAVEFLATSGDKARLVLIGYPGGWLALSPADPPTFLAAFAERAHASGAEGVVGLAQPESAFPELPQWALWRDGPALVLIALGGLALLALLGYLILVFPQLPPQMALRFNAQGQPIRFGPPRDLFTLTLIGAAVWGLNRLNTVLGILLHRRESERVAAYLLFGAAVIVQLLAWVAAIGLLTAGRAA
jgi:hypothetical protein